MSFEPVDHDGEPRTDGPCEPCSPFGKDDIRFGLAALAVLILIGVAVGMITS